MPPGLAFLNSTLSRPLSVLASHSRFLHSPPPLASKATSIPASSDPGSLKNRAHVLACLCPPWSSHGSVKCRGSPHGLRAFASVGKYLQQAFSLRSVPGRPAHPGAGSPCLVPPLFCQQPSPTLLSARPQRPGRGAARAHILKPKGRGGTCHARCGRRTGDREARAPTVVLRASRTGWGVSRVTRRDCPRHLQDPCAAKEVRALKTCPEREDRREHSQHRTSPFSPPWPEHLGDAGSPCPGASGGNPHSRAGPSKSGEAPRTHLGGLRGCTHTLGIFI